MMETNIVNKNIEILKKKSLIGLLVFALGVLIGIVFFNSIIGSITSLIFLIWGWFVFSKNFTRKCSLEIKHETKNLLEIMKKSNNKKCGNNQNY